MATLKELRLRIKSLKNTKKITSAMKMVSASKLKKAKDNSLKTQPYIENLNDVLQRVLNSVENVNNPLLDKRDNKKTRCIVFTSDRGLCGGFNNNLVKYFKRQAKSFDTDFEIITVGKKAKDGLKKTFTQISESIEGVSASPSFEQAKKLVDSCIADFNSHKIDSVVLFYNKFVSAISQKPSHIQLLPFVRSGEPEEKESSESKEKTNVDYIFEPDAEKLLEQLLPKQIAIQLFQCLLDNAAGEHAARMTAMENATNNASELISSLTIQMNRARQAAITTELTEIVSGAESLKG